MRSAEEHRKEIDDVLYYLERLFKQQFKFTSRTPSMIGSSEMEHTAGNIAPVLKKCAEDVEIKGERMFQALRKTGLDKRKLIKLKKYTEEVVSALAELRDYFYCIKKLHGVLPKFIPAITLGRILSFGLYKGTNRLVKFNDEPMLTYIFGLNRTFTNRLNKLMSLQQ